MNDLKQVYDYIEAHEEQYVNELIPLIQHKSVSMTHEGLQECAEFLSRQMEDAGIPNRLYPLPSGHPVIVGEVKAEVENAPTLLIYGHYDVMPEGPLEMWDSDPYDPQMRGGRLYGRGVSDNKGQLFAHIKAQEAYRKFNKLTVNLKYIFEGEEEQGSPNLLPFIESHKEELAADLVICSDASMHSSGRPTIELGLKGLCAVELTCRTMKKPQHSQYAACGPSASWRLVEALSTIKKAEGAVLIDGFYDKAVMPTQQELDALAALPPLDVQAQLDDWGMDHFLQGRKTDDFFYNYMFEPTCNIGCLNAGYIDGSKNVDVDEARCFIYMRLVPGQQPEEMTELLRRHLEARGFGDIEVRQYAGLPATKTPLDNKYVPVVTEALRSAFGDEPVVFPSVGCSAPFFMFSDVLKAPWMMIPISLADQNEHCANENLLISCWIKGIKAGAAFIDGVAKLES